MLHWDTSRTDGQTDRQTDRTVLDEVEQNYCTDEGLPYQPHILEKYSLAAMPISYKHRPNVD